MMDTVSKSIIGTAIIYFYPPLTQITKQGDVWMFETEFFLDKAMTDRRYATGTCPTKTACFDRAAEYRQYVLNEIKEGVK